MKLKATPRMEVPLATRHCDLKFGETPKLVLLGEEKSLSMKNVGNLGPLSASYYCLVFVRLLIVIVAIVRLWQVLKYQTFIINSLK